VARPASSIGARIQRASRYSSRMATNDDAAIAEFHAAARRHKAKVYGIAGIIAILIGIAAAIVTFTAADLENGAHRYELRILAVGLAFIVGGAFALFQAWRIGTGRAADFDYDVR
jgi:hypothetical protein